MDQKAEDVIYPQICRLCLVESGPRKLQNVDLENILLVVDFIKLFLDYKIPGVSVCQQCLDQLQEVSLFIKKCQHSQRILTQIAEEHTYIVQPKDEGHDSAPENIWQSSHGPTQSNIEHVETIDFPIKEELIDISFEVSKSADCIDHIQSTESGPESVFTTDNAKTYVAGQGKKASNLQVCQKCGETFQNVKIHYRKNRNCRPLNIQCEECGKTFISSAELRKHMVAQHKKDTFMCHFCSKMFHYLCKLQTHLKIHEQERYSCEICCKEYRSNTALGEHMNTHRGVSPFTCPVCEKVFTCRSSLYMHKRRHANDKRFSCSHCSKRFECKKHLERHFRIHTGERPFSCTLCPKTFTQLGNVKRHMLTHKKERSFTCEFCDKSFCLNSSLRVHLRIHTGEKPYKCHICEEGFRRSGGRRKHVIKKHGLE